MKMKCEPLMVVSPHLILRLAVWCIVLSTLGALIFWADGHTRPVRGVSGGVGFMAGLIGTGLASWFSVRARDSRLALAALLSLLAVTFWCWQIYQAFRT